MSDIPGLAAWRSTPLRSRAIFFTAVFFTFASFGFTSDVLNTGREPSLLFVLTILFSGLFPVIYAISGVILRGSFWKVTVPVVLFQILFMNWLSNLFPALPLATPVSAAALQHIQHRLVLDGVGVMIAVCLSYIGFLYVSISESRRHTADRVERTRLENEMAAARQIQQVILPDAAPSVPGFVVESVYKPALHVGGDFFQILAAPNNSLLLVLGDVAGKGLPAAMLVSLLVGAIRTAAEDSPDPALLLRRLHQRLIGRTSGSFATALAAHIAADGAVILANAGHLPPYLDGREIDLPGALPLGIAGDGSYLPTNFHLPAGSQLTFLSDGVVEAQNQQGELFGFDRARQLSTESAEKLAHAAQAFGQSDDITVVTLRCV